MSFSHVTVGRTGQTWQNQQILFLLLINCTLQATTIKIQHGYAACQIHYVFVCQCVCVRACLCVASRQKASMTQLQLFSFSAVLQTAVPQTRCCGSPRGPFI